MDTGKPKVETQNIDMERRMSHTLTLLCLSILSSFCQEEKILKIEPPVLAVEVGDAAEFVCTNISEISTDIFWTYENDTVIQQNRSDINIVTELKLPFEVTSIEDKGIYKCKTNNGNYSVEVELKVYWSPTYFTEGMIVIGINAALLLIFFFCFVYHYIKNRRKF